LEDRTVILGLGFDLIEVGRIEAALRQQDAALLDDLFTRGERLDARRRRCPARHFAACFAAKEAVVKALSTDDTRPPWREIEIRIAADGPQVILRGNAQRAAERRHVRRIFASVAQTRAVAVATVVLES
jgi:holo-[acyl-carrier protein] synthase